MTYDAVGTFKYEYTLTSSSSNGQTSTIKRTANGPVRGSMMVITDTAGQKLFGFGYSAGGDATATVTKVTPSGAVNVVETIVWLPLVQGFPGPGGSIDGLRTSAWGNGQERITYKFALPPMTKP